MLVSTIICESNLLIGFWSLRTVNCAFKCIIHVTKLLNTMISGDRLRVDLRRKNVPAAKMAILEQKFDEIKANGDLKPTAISSVISNADELDNGSQIRATSRLVRRSVSANVRKPQTLDVQSKCSFFV